MKVSISTIKNWFKSGSRPTQSQFWSTWDSFWHKDEQIPVTSIEDLQENLDSKLDVELYENNNVQSASFKNVGDGTPNVDTTEAAYREGKIGVGEPNPIETVDVVGSGKFQYTYGDNSIARATLGGENTNSEIGLPSGLIKTNTLAFFPDPSVHPSTQGYFYTGDVSTIAPTSGKLSTGIGIASLTNTKYARTTYFPSNSNGNPESEFVGIFASRHEDGNSASIQVSGKGGDLGNNEEAYLSLTSSNGGIFSAIALTPRIASIEGALLQLKEYGADTITEGYIHNDDVAATGTAATTIGALKPLGVDANGNVGKILTNGSSTTASNGLTESAGNIKLGGTILEETIIETNSNLLRIGSAEVSEEFTAFANGMTINGSDVTFQQSFANVIELTDDTTVISKFNRDLIIGLTGIIFDPGFSAGRSVDFLSNKVRFAFNNGAPTYYAIFDFLGSDIQGGSGGFSDVTYLLPKESGRLALLDDITAATALEGYSETGTLLGGDLISNIGAGPESTNSFTFDQANNRATFGFNNSSFTGFNLTTGGSIYTGFQAGNTFNRPTANGSITFAIASGTDVINDAQYSIMVGRNSNMSSGATQSACFGINHIMTQSNSFAAGASLTVSGQASGAIGANLFAKSFGEVAVGVHGEDYTETNSSSSNLVATDRIFSVGNGASTGSRSNALTILVGGEVGVGVTDLSTNTTGEALQVNGTVKATELVLTGLPIHANEAAAVTASLTTGTVYMTATGELRIKL